MYEPAPSPQHRHRHLKRKADADLAFPAASPKRFKAAATAEPEPNSINAIIHEHCRTRLFVEPIAWTHEHVRLLECTFTLVRLPRRQRSTTTEAADVTKAITAAQQDVLDDLASLGKPGMSAFQQRVLVDLMADLGIHRTS
jgi:hypothetical protein